MNPTGPIGPRTWTVGRFNTIPIFGIANVQGFADALPGWRAASGHRHDQSQALAI